MGIVSKLLPVGLDYLTRIPFERLIKTPDRTKDLRELHQILKESRQPPKSPSEEEEPEHEASEIPEEEPASIVRERPRQKPMQSTVTLEDTIDYQKKEIAKLLLLMERHYAQGLRIKGRVCDCGGQKHLLDIEALAQETIPMVREGGIYQELVDWVNKVGPETTVEAVSTGLYDKDYPIFSGEARDFRKELLGTLDVSALFNGPAKGRFVGVTIEKPELEQVEAPSETLALPSPEEQREIETASIDNPQPQS